MVLLISAAIVLAGTYKVSRKVFKMSRKTAVVVSTGALLATSTVLVSQVEAGSYTTAAQGTVSGLAALVIIAYAGKQQLRKIFR